eukprot:TRINITY_DN34002_c0_g1_i1.p1 TRINITY_DN34002_c0_g1~~TRINITY_DN34002_c0_g1_i1.p1  ORF type:complete len:107 (+),score=1.63 TRINITY_DN34002_c0_g1_i1:269-589(+)
MLSLNCLFFSFMLQHNLGQWHGDLDCRLHVPHFRQAKLTHLVFSLHTWYSCPSLDLHNHLIVKAEDRAPRSSILENMLAISTHSGSRRINGLGHQIVAPNLHITEL